MNTLELLNERAEHYRRISEIDMELQARRRAVTLLLKPKAKLPSTGDHVHFAGVIRACGNSHWAVRR